MFFNMKLLDENGKKQPSCCDDAKWLLTGKQTMKLEFVYAVLQPFFCFTIAPCTKSPHFCYHFILMTSQNCPKTSLCISSIVLDVLTPYIINSSLYLYIKICLKYFQPGG